MRDILGFKVLPEMLGLWMIETGICFFTFYLALHGAPDFAVGNGWQVNLGDAVGDAVVLALTVGLVGFALGLYRPTTCLEIRRMVMSTSVGAVASLPAVWLVAKALNIDLTGLFRVTPGWLGLLLAWELLLLATRLLYTLALRMDVLVRRVAIVGAPPAAERLIDAIGGLRRWVFRIEAIQPPAGFDLAKLPRGLWGVVFADAAVATAGGHQAGSGTVPSRVRRFDAETFWEDQLCRIDIDAAAGLGDGVAAYASLAVAGRAATAARRALDIAAASLLLLLTAPVLAITAVIIRLESPGPLIYRQERTGLDGRSFTLFKFRSMRTDAERLGPTWAAPGDARATRFGRLIRKVRIDELPQLFNILRGDMSMVGPRPERPHFVDQLARVIPLYHERARVKPGLTGWAQVNYPYGASVADAKAKLSYDLYYLKHRTLAFDLMILLATVRVILFQEGAR